MASIKDESAVDLLVEQGLTEPEAWAKVQDKIQEEKDQKPESKPRKKKDIIVVILDPDGKLPDNLTGYVIQKEETCLDEDGNEMDDEATREWGSAEIHKLLEVIPHYLTETKSYLGYGIDDMLENAKASELKAMGLNVKTRQPVWIAPVGTKRIVQS